jgi:Fe-S cluster biogenesis protein NfuA
MPSLERQIEEVLNQIRPALKSDGGGIEFVKFDKKTGVVYVRLKGACVGCPMADFTLSMSVSAVLKDAIKEITKVISVEHEQNS